VKPSPPSPSSGKSGRAEKLSSVYQDILKNELAAKEKNLTVVLESVQRQSRADRAVS
jgi:dipeptidase D